MTTTMQLIAKQTVGAGGASSVTFSNIPQTYTDLKLVMSVDTTPTGTYNWGYITFNGVTSNYSQRFLYGDGSSAQSFTWGASSQLSSGMLNNASQTASTFTSCEYYIPNYTSTTTAKSVSSESAMENNATSAYLTMGAGLWNPGTQDYIRTIAIAPETGSFVEFSTFYLYGISNSTTTQATTVPYASGGDVITTDGSYWYHAFKYSGSFTPLKNLTCDYLVVAGGGGGGGVGGGGGAGGLRSTVTATGGGGSLESPLSLLANTAYTAQVGSGGAGSTGGDGSVGSVGGNSVFATITSTGGGYGAGGGANAGAGGSGGGSRNGTAGARTTGQGYVGAVWTSLGGGGGGAGAAGSVGSGSGTGGNGGAGVAISALATATSTGVSNYYAGGGGGGSNSGIGGAVASSGGAGGGGAGSLGNTGVNGTANTGGGGGGGGFNSITGFNGGAGGSGLIIVRYAV